MQVARVIAPVMIATGALLAGCGASSKSTSTAASSPSASSSSKKTASAPKGSAAGTARVALITTKHVKLGAILAVGSKKQTVYLFEADKGHSSSCTGACAAAWPPVIGKPQASGGANASALGTITRPGGTMQVTYKGHPLYRFIKDKDDGDAYGQGSKAFGASWYVLKPSGSKVDES
jgi:predicted lipoprotein with Yx(FWY)xxD motif